MSETSNENDDVGLISDDELPEDLRPEDLRPDEEREVELEDEPDDPLPEG